MARNESEKAPKPNGKTGGLEWITIQGHLFTWKAGYVIPFLPPKNKRGIVGDFSRSSRLRMLKMIATVDWKEAGMCLFVTLTYPDEAGKQDRAKLNKARAVFWRSVESHLGRKCCALWRIEWQPRKSGRFKGEWMPHYHLIVFNCLWLPKAKVREWWKQAIQSPILPRTQVMRMRDEKQTVYYVAKYAAKVDDTVLVDAAKHNNYNGRHWGVLRKELMPFCGIQELFCRRSDLTDELRAKLLKHWPDGPVEYYESFCLFGPLAINAAKEFFEKNVDFDAPTG